MDIFYRVIAWFFRNSRYKDRGGVPFVSKKKFFYFSNRTEDDIVLPVWFVILVLALFALDIGYEFDHSFTVPAIWSWLITGLTGLLS